MFNNERWRTEELYVFRASGNLGDYGQVVCGTAGIVSKSNPIPSIMDNLFSKPCSENFFLARFALATHFAKERICKDKESVDLANDVIKWFLNPHCPACHGTRVKNIEQEICDVCGGVDKQFESDRLRRGVWEVEHLFDWREVQLRKHHKVGKCIDTHGSM